MASSEPPGITIGPYEIAGRPTGDPSAYLGRRPTAAGRGRLYQLHVTRLAESRLRDLAREVELCARLNHPAIPPIVDSFAWQKSQVVVFEHVDGIRLSRLLPSLENDGERLPDGAIWYLGLQTVGALARGHAVTDATGKLSPIVHGQLSPQHLLVSWEGRVLLLGLGLPTMLEAEASAIQATETRSRFAAPEWREGQPLTPSADVYAAALMLWSLLSGRPPPPAGERVPLMREVRNDVPDTVAAAIDLALEPSPGLRKIRCVDFERELRRVTNVAVGKAELRDSVEMTRALMGLWSVAPPPVEPWIAEASSGGEGSSPAPGTTTRDAKDTAAPPKKEPVAPRATAPSTASPRADRPKVDAPAPPRPGGNAPLTTPATSAGGPRRESTPGVTGAIGSPAPPVPAADVVAPPAPSVPAADVVAPPAPSVPTADVVAPPAPSVPTADVVAPPVPPTPAANVEPPPAPSVAAASMPTAGAISPSMADRKPRKRRSALAAAAVALAVAAGCWVAWDAGLLGRQVEDAAPVTSTQPEGPSEAQSAAETAPPQSTAAPSGAPSPLPEGSAPKPQRDADAGNVEPATGGAAPIAQAAAEGGDGSELLSYEGYLVVRSSAQAEVYVQGKHIGQTNQRLRSRCRQKFIRIGTLPGPKWLNSGVGVRIGCRTVTEVTIEPEG